ncbi:hypothetical protein HMPREF9162_0267 [Selenomonas sp. oral taxon 137 str. F0430]|uniref:HMA2 domain-containing protein n=1 Tax=Selenomonas sp. oral taxon 137 TaxID=712531 RepID=UPI0001EB16EC|nr:hypothetical protein [Selenomonas sp. oral taxon 137]EFR39809.1 hypothetical protein HMPREF9162_0267 [Selenomonas sp. oral taxon 137 str. F0430]
MSYVSGFMLGASLAKYLRQYMSGGCTAPTSFVVAGQGKRGKRPRGRLPRTGDLLLPFSCVHASAGRRRYRTPYLTEETAELLTAGIRTLSFVREIDVNADSGSILFVYHPEDEAHILVLAEELEKIFSKGHAAPHVGTLAQSIRSSVHAFSGWIQAHSGGALDLNSLAAGLFFLIGIRQLVLSNAAANAPGSPTRTSPSGFQMLWWGLTLMRGWRTV